MSDISNINPKWVTIPPFYKCAKDTSAAAVNDCGMKNILLTNDFGKGKEVSSGRMDCDNKLLYMKWEMIAKDIAKNIFGKDINAEKGKELAAILKQDNGNCEKPFEVLKGLNMSFGEAVVSTVMLSRHYDQYYSYQRFLGEGDNMFGIKWGSFPRELPIKISDEFKKAVFGAKAAAAPAKAATPRRTPRTVAKTPEQPPEQPPVQPPVEPPKTENCPKGFMRDLSGDCIDTTGGN